MKRAFLTLASAAIAVLAVLRPVRAGAAGLPNIVILYADDMGYGDLGANHPGSKIPTPHLDALAAQGMRFTDGHSSSGICTPSRYAMLTGRHHWRDFHGIVNTLGPTVFKKDQLTLPGMLREKGYTTTCIGKWHLGWNWEVIKLPGATEREAELQGKKIKVWGPESFDWSRPVPDGPLDHGFDHYFGCTVINFPPYAWIEDNKIPVPPDTVLIRPAGEPKEGGWECRPGPARSDWDFTKVLPMLTRRSVEFVQSRKGQAQPFFLYMAFPSPHAPIIPNDEFDGKSQAGPFGDYVVQTDDACGRILTALREAGLEDSTIVIFSADNGPEFYAYARDQKYGHWSAAPFRGLKRDIYEGGHHVPLVIRWPGLTKPGTVTGALISQVDFMATFAALTGFNLPETAAGDSFNFLPWLRGEVPTPPRDTIVHNTNKDDYALRHRDWLLIDGRSGYVRPAPRPWVEKHRQPADDAQPVELFNLKDDPGQRHNIAAENGGTVSEMRALLKKIREQGHSAPRFH
ncbi:MAG: arylsulfatase [Verrucomicrobiota bacterium]